MSEMQIRKTSNGDLTIYHITDRMGATVTLDPQEALLVLQFLYERVDEITRLVNDLPSEPLLQECKYCGQYHESHLIEQCPMKPGDLLTRSFVKLDFEHQIYDVIPDGEQAEGEL